MHEFQQLSDLLSQHPLVGDLAKTGLRSAVGAIVRRAKARLDRDNERYPGELSRIWEMIEEMQATLADAIGAGIWQPLTAEREAAEPSFESFADRAVNVAADSRVESKRRLVGRLIMRRLQIADCGDQETLHDRILRAARDLTEPQLLALAALAFLRDLGIPESPFADHDEAEAWLNERHARAVRRFKGVPWTDDDLEMLGQTGTIAVALRLHGTFLGGEHADDLDQWLYANGLSSQTLLEDDAGSPQWRSRFLERFPVSSAIRSLSRGTLFVASDDKRVPYRLDEQRLSSAGCVLAAEVLKTIKRWEANS